MILTPEEKAEWLDACAAMLAGEPIEFRSPLNGQWLDAINIQAGRAHRRKPAPAPTLKLGHRITARAVLGSPEVVMPGYDAIQ
jgi:hypothetical protein